MELTTAAASVHTVWDTLFSPLLEFALIAAVLALVVGGAPFRAASTMLQHAVKSSVRIRYYRMIHRFELQKLLPVLVFTTLIVACYAVHKTTRMIGNLVPPHPSLNDGSALMRTDPRILDMIWRNYPGADSFAEFDAILKRDAAASLGNLDNLSWHKQRAFLNDDLAYNKFLALWLLACVMIAARLRSLSRPRMLRAVGILMAVLTVAAGNLWSQRDAAQEEASQWANAAYATVMISPSRSFVASRDAKELRVIQKRLADAAQAYRGRPVITLEP